MDREAGACDKQVVMSVMSDIADILGFTRKCNRLRYAI